MAARRVISACVVGLALATAGVWAFADAPSGGYAPDPPAHASDKQWVFDVTYDKGASTLERARSVTAKKAIATPRVMGRFALELWVGKELLDRVRFDVPLLGDDDGERDPKRPRKKPTFSRVSVKLKVQMADHPRAAVLAFVDRSTGTTQKFFWPPEESGALVPLSARGDAGVGDASVSDASMSDAMSDAAVSDAMSDAAVSDAMSDAAVSDGGAGASDAGR